MRHSKVSGRLCHSRERAVRECRALGGPRDVEDWDFAVGGPVGLGCPHVEAYRPGLAVSPEFVDRGIKGAARSSA